MLMYKRVANSRIRFYFSYEGKSFCLSKIIYLDYACHNRELWAEPCHKMQRVKYNFGNTFPFLRGIYYYEILVLM